MYIERVDGYPDLIRGDALKIFNGKKISFENFADKLTIIRRTCQDIVGFVPCAEHKGAVYLPLFQAMDELDRSGGYINGWEYAAGEGGQSLFEESVSVAESLLPKLGPGGRMLDSVMKWVFISKGPSMGSEWHVDPIGSCAWMLQIYGTKEWFVETGEGEIVSGSLYPGNLLVLPSGLRHRVENKGTEFNLALSHNWVEPGGESEKNMWNLVEELLVNFPSPDGESFLERIENECDNILFGLMMVLVHLSPTELQNLVPTEISAHFKKFHK
jgi:hypothetical protein